MRRTIGCPKLQDPSSAEHDRSLLREGPYLRKAYSVIDVDTPKLWDACSATSPPPREPGIQLIRLPEAPQQHRTSALTSDRYSREEPALHNRQPDAIDGHLRGPGRVALLVRQPVNARQLKMASSLAGPGIWDPRAAGTMYPASPLPRKTALPGIPGAGASGGLTLVSQSQLPCGLRQWDEWYSTASLPDLVSRETSPAARARPRGHDHTLGRRERRTATQVRSSAGLRPVSLCPVFRMPAYVAPSRRTGPGRMDNFQPLSHRSDFLHTALSPLCELDRIP